MTAGIARLAAAISVSGLSISAGQDPPPLFAGRASELVVLPVTVTDRRGAFVADLTADRFSVYDNGRRQDLTLFSGEDTPVSVGLVIDDSGSMRPKLPDVVDAALVFARLSNASDELFTISFNDTVLDHPDSLAPVSDMSGLALKLRSLVPQGRTALYDALVAGLDRVESGTRPRKALIVLSDGGDNASRATLDAVMARARRANVTIFTIGLFDDEDFDRNPGVLKSLAEATGGERFLPRSSKLLAAACERIARELRAGYTLGYTPPDRDGAYHRVRVDVSRADGQRLTARTRPGYFAAARP
jgi:VWFA-related protein